MNKSEEFVAKLCERTFLSLWSHPSPRKSKDSPKELCDILVVCDPDIIIISVKEIKVTDSGNIEVDWGRWHGKAIEESSGQIYGAERHITRSQMTNVITKDGKEGISIPVLPMRRIHRIAVALGGEGKVPVYCGNFDKGFIHVFDKLSFEIVMRELDTITDFLRYLRMKEELLNGKTQVLCEGGEEDLLVAYICQDEILLKKPDQIIITSDMWDGFSKSLEYTLKKEADKESYVWDRLIENMSRHFKTGILEYGNSPETERILRIMAKEDRFSRRVLSKCFLKFMDLASQGKVRSRYAPSHSGVIYVFLACPHGTNRKERQDELRCRCFIVRGLRPEQTIVLGIATEQYVKGKGFSFDLVYFYKDEWTKEDQQLMESLQEQTGFFKNPKETPLSEDEYPKTADNPNGPT